jgi:ABC-2 type transport system permease protein
VILAAATLWRRELVRFYRQPNRIIGALGSPLVFWLFIGSGMSGSFAGGNYLEYIFPGIVVLTVLFTSIFSTISIIEDRREGFLQSVLVAPVPRSGIVLGKVLGGATVALVQGVLMLALGPAIGVWPTAMAVVVLFVTAFALTALGFLIAWRMDSTQGFHAIMNLFLMPMWFLSGALFPASGAPKWLEWVMRANPLTYGIQGLRNALASSGDVALPILMMAGFGVLLFALATAAASRR